jgi:hypothetical protein
VLRSCRWNSFSRQFLLFFPACLYPLIPNWLDRRLPATHEGYRYLLLSDWFRDAMAAGIWYPRWLPEMNGGFGYPAFVFYQPGYFFLNAAVSLFAEPLFLRQLLTLSVVALLGGCGVYLLARCFTSSGYALLLVLLFQIAPYVHTNLFLRGDLSEWMALELMPWPVYFLLQFCRSAEGGVIRHRLFNWLGLALATASVCYCHPVALMFLPLLLLFIGAVGLSKSAPARPFVAWGELAGGVVLGLALSSPYWLTVMLMKPYVNVAAALDGFVAWKNTIVLEQLLFGSLLGKDGFKEMVGAPFAVCALVGWWRGRKQPFIFGAGLAYLAMLLLITPAGQWFWRLYPFSLLQFPWRLVVFAPLLQIICMLGLLGAAGSGQSRIGMGRLVGGVCLLALWSLHGHFGWKPAEPPGTSVRFDQQALACLRNFAQTGQPGRYVTKLDAGEWMPLTAAGIATTPARGTLLPNCEDLQRVMAGLAIQMGMPGLYDLQPEPRPLLEVDQQGWLVSTQPPSSMFRLDYQLSGTVPVNVTINQIYLPGWMVMLNGLPLSLTNLERHLLPDGRIRLAVPPGEWHLQAWYDGPPGWRIRNTVMAALCSLAAVYWAYRWSRERRNR